MLQALWAASAGMQAQQRAVDSIAQNLSNLNTPAFKRYRISFSDVLSGTLGNAGLNEAESGGIAGAGVLADVSKDFTHGSLEHTGRPLDLAIDGDGFFRVKLADGEAYTRDGTFHLDGSGVLVTSQGSPVLLEDGTFLQVPPARRAEDIIVVSNGLVSLVKEDGELEALGTLGIVQFKNPAGLMPTGWNLYSATDQSGRATIPEVARTGRVKQGFLERSNVELTEEMANLIIAQRAYEINARAALVADQMMGLANNLRY